MGVKKSRLHVLKYIVSVMGTGASLSTPDGAKLMRELQAEYAKYAELGYGDLVIRDKLAARYDSFLASNKSSVSAAAPPASAPEVDNGPTSSAKSESAGKGLGKGKPSTKKNSSRRRSFEPSAVKDMPQTMLAQGSELGVEMGNQG